MGGRGGEAESSRNMRDIGKKHTARTNKMNNHDKNVVTEESFFFFFSFLT